MKLLGTSFCTCVFEGCEIVLAKLANVTLNDVTFRSCKIVGVNFTDCNDFGFSPVFEDCALDGCVVYGKALRKTRIGSSRLVNCDFTECDFRESDFSLSSFDNVRFHNCDLQKADFRTARGYAIDPLSNKVRNLRSSLPEAASFLPFLGIKLEP
jgi:uncharacterized protein YjbI with pentapeptide repeats